MDTMDFVKRAWATLDLSSPFAPTLSVEELDKRIADLRAVEQWLALNQGMLHNTIQGLEIQRGTLAAVQNLSDSFGRLTRPPGEDTAEVLARFAAATVRPPQAPAVDNPFARAAPQPAPEPQSAPAPQPASAAEPADGDLPPLQGWGASMDPLAWWQVLQGNFEQIARMAGGQPATEPAASSGSEAPPPGRRKAAAKAPTNAARRTPGKAKAASTGTKPAPRRKGRQAASGNPATAGAWADAKSGEGQ